MCMCAPRCAGLQLAGMKFIDTLFMIVVCFSPSLSFFVKRWPSKGRIGKHKRSRRKTRFRCLTHCPYTQSCPADNPISSSTKRSIILFIHSSYMCVWLYFGCWDTQPKKAVRPKCSLPVSLTVPVRICARLCVRRCVRATSRAGNSSKTPQVSVQQQERWNGRREILPNHPVGI